MLTVLCSNSCQLGRCEASSNFVLPRMDASGTLRFLSPKFYDASDVSNGCSEPTRLAMAAAQFGRGEQTLESRPAPDTNCYGKPR